jgi:hypothetical protein
MNYQYLTVRTKDRVGWISPNDSWGDSAIDQSST